MAKLSANPAVVKLSARKWGRRCRFSMVEDFHQEAMLAQLENRDAIDAVRHAWKYWVFGTRHHGRVGFDRPVHVGPVRDYELRAGSVDEEIIVRDLVAKIWQRASRRAREAIQANLVGSPYVWRPEIGSELRAIAASMIN